MQDRPSGPTCQLHQFQADGTQVDTRATPIPASVGINPTDHRLHTPNWSHSGVRWFLRLNVRRGGGHGEAQVISTRRSNVRARGSHNQPSSIHSRLSGRHRRHPSEIRRVLPSSDPLYLRDHGALSSSVHQPRLLRTAECPVWAIPAKTVHASTSCPLGVT